MTTGSTRGGGGLARDKLMEAMDSGYGASFDLSAIRGLQDDTLRGYVRQIKRLARVERMRPGAGPRMVFEDHLLHMVQKDPSENAVKIILAAAGLVEKMGWLPPVVRKADWSLVQAVEVHRSQEERASKKEWAHVDDLVRLCARARSFSD